MKKIIESRLKAINEVISSEEILKNSIIYA
jgi:hypothetical protein